MEMDKQSEFKQWVNDYSDLLYGYTVQRGMDTEPAKDIIQDTFLSAWRSMDTYKREVSVKNWLFIILKSKITDHYRKSSTKLAVETIEREHQDHTYFDAADHWKDGVCPEPWQVHFDNKIEVKEFYHILKNCSKKLKEIQTTVFMMKYMDGLESEDICRVLSISSSNYWVLIHRAKVQLRACLQKNWVQK